MKDSNGSTTGCENENRATSCVSDRPPVVPAPRLANVAMEDYDFDTFYSNLGQDPFDVLDPFDSWWHWARTTRYKHLGQPMQTSPRTQVDVQDVHTRMPLNGLINLASYNYLGLGQRLEVIEATCEALRKYGFGASGSPILSGNFDVHEELGEKLAAFTGKEAVLLFPTGYGANLGVLSGLMRPNDLVVADHNSHASIVDGIVLSKARSRFFRHNDAQSLERKLVGFPGKKLVVVEGVYSMDGDIVNLPEIVEVAARHGARIMIDEAHSGFLFGGRGRGIAEHFGLEEAIDIHIGTFSKTLAGVGGYVAGSRQLINYLRVFARSQFFSCALPPSVVVGLLKGLEIVEAEPQLRTTLFSNANFIKERLVQAGADIGSCASHIIPIFIRDDARVFTVVEELIDEGVYLHPVRYPAVRKNKSRIRVFASAAHTTAELAYATDALIRVLGRHGQCR